MTVRVILGLLQSLIDSGTFFGMALKTGGQLRTMRVMSWDFTMGFFMILGCLRCLHLAKSAWQIQFFQPLEGLAPNMS